MDKYPQALREGMIILPAQDNDGNELFLIGENLITALVKAFGGCTVIEAQGYWTNDKGHTVGEKVRQFIVAYEPNTYFDEVLAGLAKFVGFAARQDAVYVRYADGRVQIHSLTEAKRPATP